MKRRDKAGRVAFDVGNVKVTRFGKFPVNFQVAGYYNVESPRDGAEWQLRLQLQMLFPK